MPPFSLSRSLSVVFESDRNREIHSLLGNRANNPQDDMHFRWV